MPRRRIEPPAAENPAPATVREWYVELGRRMGEARVQAGVQQIEVARLLGVDPSKVCLMEQGRKRITTMDLVLVSDAIGVPIKLPPAPPRK